MAVNYKSKQQTITNTSENILLTPAAGVDTVIISSIVCKYQSGSASTGVELKIQKSGDIIKSFFQADFGDTVNAGADYPAGKAAELLTSPMILESGDNLIAQIEGGGFTFFLQYAERTTAAATGSIENLDNVSDTPPSNNQVLIYNSTSGQYEPGSVSDAGTGSITGTNGLTEEAPNRFMKRLDLLDDLGGAGASSPADRLYISPDEVYFLTQFSTNSVSKVTFQDIVASIVQVGAQNLIDAGVGNSSTYTADGSTTLGDLDGDGSVSVSDLLEFLTQFGQVYGTTVGTFNPSLTVINSGSDIQLVSQSTYYRITYGSGQGNYIIEQSGSQDVTFTPGSGQVDFEENQIEIGPLGGKYIKTVGVTSGTCGISVTPKEDGTQIQFWMYVKAVDSNGTLLSTEVRDLGTYTYNTGPAVDAGFGQQIVSESNSTVMNETSAAEFQVYFEAVRLSANSIKPAVTFDQMKIEFKKS